MNQPTLESSVDRGRDVEQAASQQEGVHPGSTIQPSISTGNLGVE